MSGLAVRLDYSSLVFSQCYSRAKASIGLSLDAERAGIKPKTIPITDEVITAAITEVREYDSTMFGAKCMMR